VEPLNDQELNQVLNQWTAPAAPRALKFPKDRSGWRWLLQGSIRIPAPIALLLVIAAGVWLYSTRSTTKAIAHPKPVSLADFQPVKQMQPRVIGRANEAN
jgi:hypothetical protein